VKQATGIAEGVAPPSKAASQHHEQRIDGLIGRLPERLQTTIRWLRRPGLRWVSGYWRAYCSSPAPSF